MTGSELSSLRTPKRGRPTMQCGISRRAVRGVTQAPGRGDYRYVERSRPTVRGSKVSARTGGLIGAAGAVFGLDNFAARLLTSGYRYKARRRGIRESVGTRAE